MVSVPFSCDAEQNFPLIAVRTHQTWTFAYECGVERGSFMFFCCCGVPALHLEECCPNILDLKLFSHSRTKFLTYVAGFILQPAGILELWVFLAPSSRLAADASSLGGNELYESRRRVLVYCGNPYSSDGLAARFITADMELGAFFADRAPPGLPGA